MATNSHPHYSPYWNTLPVDLVNDKLVSAPEASIKISSSLAPTFRSFFLDLILSSALIFAFISAPGPVFIINRYTNEDLQKAAKLALDFFFQGQDHSQAQAAAVLALVSFLT